MYFYPGRNPGLVFFCCQAFDLKGLCEGSLN